MKTADSKPDNPIPDDIWPLRRVRLSLVRNRVDRPPTGRAAEIDRLIAEFGGDARAALAAVLHDFDMIVADYEAAISGGFVRRAPKAD